MKRIAISMVFLAEVPDNVQTDGLSLTLDCDYAGLIDPRNPKLNKFVKIDSYDTVDVTEVSTIQVNEG